MKLCSIDSSTKATGMALFIDGKYEKHILLDHHKIKDVDERINIMIKSIIHGLHDWNPDIVWIEHPQGHGKNVSMVAKLSEILGSVRCWCVIRGREYYEIMPSQWRKWLPEFEQGKKTRNELKEKSVRYIKDKLGLDVTDDEADAINIGLAVIKYYESLTK